MTWYAAHVIEAIRPIRQKVRDVLVFENIILIEASNEKEALAKAKKHAAESIVEDDSLTIDGEKATACFVGVRKLMTVSNPCPLNQEDDQPVSGTEVSYSKFKIKNSDLKKFAKGNPIMIEYLE